MQGHGISYFMRAVKETETKILLTSNSPLKKKNRKKKEKKTTADSAVN